MEKKIIEINGKNVAIINSSDLIITDEQTALDFISTIDYFDNCSNVIINKEAITEEFFKLSSGLCGAILQKFVNYTKKLAIVGDFSIYTSKPLHDFIYECNNGKDIFFVKTTDEAIDKFSVVL